jgi:hypothetical protein
MSDDELRSLIIERGRTARAVAESFLLDCYLHLLIHGASPDEAIKALSTFVDYAVAVKARSHLQVVK